MLSEKFAKSNIILASASPRRQELFKSLQLDFSINVKNIDEVYPTDLKKEQITNYLARQKANAFEGKLAQNDLLITADTIVWFKNSAFEKPSSKQEAKSMLNALSNSTHQVITSVCIKSTEKEVIFFDITEVWFKKLTSNEINYYIKNYNPLDKAGAYGVQEWIGYIGIKKLVGSYYNVMGLPVHKLYEELMHF